MKRKIIILYLFLSLFFFNCNNKENFIKSDSAIESKENKISTDSTDKNIKPIFLNLSPKMSIETYDKNIRSNPNIIDNSFIIKLNNKNISFDIIKQEDRINLTYNNLFEVSHSKLNSKISEKYIKNNDSLIKGLKNILEEKYGNPKTILPFKNVNGLYFTANQINEFVYDNKTKEKFLIKKLSDFEFKKEFYYIFQDSIKTIVFGFNKFGEITMNKEELENEMTKPKFDYDKKNSESVGEYFKRYAKSRNKAEREINKRLHNNNPVQFGVDFELSYIHNFDFNKILEEINYNYSLIKSINHSSDSLKIERENIIENNKNSL